MDYGELTFSGGKLHYNNLSSGVSGNSYFAFNYGDPVSANVVYNPNLADFDYFSAEFDMDFSAATPDLYISFLCRTGSGASASSGMIAIKNENESLLCFAGDGSYSRKVELGDHAHFSLFVMPEDDPEYSVCLVYVDGEYVGYCYGINSGAVTANGLRVGCSSNYYPEGNESFSMDNVLLAVFGDGSGGYSGDLADLFFDPETPLSECADSVLGGAIR